jgi:hypothetical protein
MASSCHGYVRNETAGKNECAATERSTDRASVSWRSGGLSVARHVHRALPCGVRGRFVKTARLLALFIALVSGFQTPVPCQIGSLTRVRAARLTVCPFGERSKRSQAPSQGSLWGGMARAMTGDVLDESADRVQ